MKRFVLVLFLLSGCAEAQEALQDARTAVHDTGTSLERLRVLIVALCDTEPAPEVCPELVRDFNEVQAAYTRVNEAMP